MPLIILAMTLTDEQALAAYAPPVPIVIMAGPGSGKTATIVERLAYLAHSGYSSSRLLLLTFTNKAAKEAKHRLSVVGQDFNAGTFHSYCMRWLRQFGSFQVVDEDDSVILVQDAMEAIGLKADRRSAQSTKSWISTQRNMGYSLETPPPDVIGRLVDVWGEYNELKSKYHLMDFDDLLDNTANDPRVLSYAARLYDGIMVDETQDTNQVQYSLVNGLAAEHRNVTIVGDVDQCVALDTEITVGDNKSVMAGDLTAGADIVAAGEKRLHNTIVRDVHRTRAPVVKILLSDGKELTCSLTHKMFAQFPDKDIPSDRNKKIWVTLTINYPIDIEAHSHQITLSNESLGSEPNICQSSAPSTFLREICNIINEGSTHSVSVVGSQYSEILEIESMARGILSSDAQYRQRAFFSDGECYDVVPASMIYPGAILPVVSDDGSVNGVTVENVEAGAEQDLIDIEVPSFGNFIANGIVTHNSIYGWRGAMPDNIQRFVDDYQAKVVHLSVNHRSTEPIVNFSRQIIDQAPSPLRPANLRASRLGGFEPQVVSFMDGLQEAEAIAAWVLSLLNQGVSSKEIAVLFRTNPQTQAVETALVKRKIKYTVVGAMRFFDRKEVKDTLAWLRLTANPYDSPSLRRVLGMLPSIGKGTIAAICDLSNEQGISMIDGVLRYTPKQTATKEALVEFYQDIMKIRDYTPYEAIKYLAEGPIEFAYRGDDKEKFRMDNVEQLAALAASYDSIDQFVTMVTLASAADTEHDGVCLSTCHAAKGLEFQAVWVAGVELGLFPHFNSHDNQEECRLLYVAATRAKDLLIMSYCHARTKWGRTVQAGPSPFIKGQI